MEFEYHSSCSEATVEVLSNHVGFPARLPGSEDESPQEVGIELIQRLIAAVRYITNLPNVPLLEQWNSLLRSLELTQVVNKYDGLLKESITSALEALSENDFVLLHIIEQNASVVVRHQVSEHETTLIFEISEASPKSGDVLQSSSSLVMDFPSCAVTLPIADFHKCDLKDELAAYLAQASGESVKHFAAHTKKAQSQAYESRDTVDPIMMTGILKTVLESYGKPCSPLILRKRVRDDACWDTKGINPWRRSPMWLILRVATERHLRCIMGAELGLVQYKLLMCLFHSNFLSEYAEYRHRNDEVLDHLRKKLAMRIDKLDCQQVDVTKSKFVDYLSLRSMLDENFDASIRNASAKITRISGSQKFSQSIDTRNISYGVDVSDLELKMINSLSYVEEVKKSVTNINTVSYSQNHNISLNIDKLFVTPFTEKYLTLAKFESDIKDDIHESSFKIECSREKCIAYAEKIGAYLDDVGSSYDKNPEQKSIMLLLVLKLWTEMDKIAVNLNELLKEFSPGIPKDITNVLLLTNPEDLQLLFEIRKYLETREQNCNKPPCTIFENPSNECFAVKYYDRSPDSSVIRSSHAKIEREAELQREMKRNQLTVENNTYRSIEQEAEKLTHDHPDSWNNQLRCKKCYLHRKKRRLRISIHEWSLPSSMVSLKTVIFELNCPMEFAAYRDATWKIMAGLASSSFHSKTDSPELLLKDYGALNKFYKASWLSKFVLASNTKPFEKTHYAQVKLPAKQDDVLLPNGTNFKYFDIRYSIWSDQLKKLSFAHHCHMSFPHDSPYLSLVSSAQLPADRPGPSSYSIIASQTKCPKGLLVNEFLAVKSLFLGYEQRWPQIMIELGSPNINFSSESIMVLMNFLALQAGPSNNADFKGIIHRVFDDEKFCTQLIYWIDWRLDDISSTLRRREVYCMEILITLSIRVYDLGVQNCRGKSLLLIEKARSITKKWLSKLNEDIDEADDLDVENIFSRYATWVALLCRRTFAVFFGSKKIPEAHLQTYIDCSISLQLNFSDSTSPLPESLKAALIRDLKIAWGIRDTLCQSISTSVIISSISKYNPDLNLSNENQAKLELLQEPNTWWVKITNQKVQGGFRDLALHLLTGNLLINGKSVGVLPVEWRDDVTIKRIFGTESFRAWNSMLPETDYVLARQKEGHRIYFGKRNGANIVKTMIDGDIYELLPAEIFLGENSHDLPNHLIRGCVHWFNTRQNRIEIRQLSNPWKCTKTNWIIDLKDYSTYRKICEKKFVRIIDPHSSLFRAIAQVFRDFENSNELVMFQKDNGPIEISLPRFDLSFFINARNRFECKALSSEIDINQNAGTWYGLRSKLVLREIARFWKNRRSIIVPTQSRSVLVLTGDLSIEKSGPHVEIKVQSTGNYVRFTINEVLGRLDTTDTSSQYLKAYYHAITSCIHPDPLTGRTGTEEAFHCLDSSLCQPATPLSIEQKNVLERIAKLTPRRDYFPKNLKQMQITHWNLNMNISAQHDGFKGIVNRILDQSQQLSHFFDGQNKDQRESVVSAQELTQRSLTRRLIYDRPISFCTYACDDMKYSSREISSHWSCLTRVKKCIRLIQEWSYPTLTTLNLKGLFEEWSNFQGFEQPFTSPLISDLLENNFASYWGSLANSMRSSNKDFKCKIMLLLGTISFNEKINMDAIMMLVAFAVSDELKEIDPPNWPSYERYKMNEEPTVLKLLSLMRPLIDSTGSEDDEYEMRKSQKIEATNLAKNLTEQWPCAVPICEDSKHFSYIDVDEMIDVIRSEWNRLFQNYEFSLYLKKIQPIINKICHITSKDNLSIALSNTSPDEDVMPRGRRRVPLPTLSSDLLSGDLFTTNATYPKIKDIHDVGHEHSVKFIGSKLQVQHKGRLGREITDLKLIVGNLESSESIIERRYATDLMESLDALETKNLEPQQSLKRLKNLHAYVECARDFVQTMLNHIAFACENLMRHRSKWLKKVGLWPYIGPISLLENLRSTSHCKFGPGVKQILVEYAVSITKLQRVNRISEARFKKQTQRVTEELNNPGHENWDPLSQPDWLLLEIDSNILFRPVQIEVARETISPAFKKNSVLQMNMGQGKTSCILPMATVALSDGNNLMRVIVPRALLAQNIQLLQIRLGGLVGRGIKHIPFSRKLAKKHEICSIYLKQLQYIQKSQGVMVTLPDHILSFKLSGQQALLDGRLSVAKEMFEAQKWISSRSRDVIDECDEILALRTQLIYPSGTQKVVDGNSSRWETIENILRLVVVHIEYLESTYSHTITTTRRIDGSFPLVCFVQEKIEELLISRLVDEICSGRSQIFPGYSPEDLSAIKEFISKTDVRDSVASRIQSLSMDKTVYSQVIYLLRGFFVHQILITSLKKRWNVQYGLHPLRDPIAVPYHAKGCPSDQSEWGHPDVAITLTCLAFYYEGLKIKQFHETLRSILETDDPVQVYEGLIQESKIPQNYGHWNNINVEDEIIVKEMWKYLRYSVNIINFFLNIFVFPKHATQFEIKLTTTGWDIPSFEMDSDDTTRNSTSLTTGFSGTNDWKGLLPLTICQQDLKSLSHTNAEVLSYLLQERNRGYFHTIDSNGRRLSERGLLQEITNQNISVLIDAGAQIMEMDNLSVVKAWLEINTDSPAAFFFNRENRPRILYRGGRQVSFYSSIYAENLQECLIYLDQAHTRGTDLKMKPLARGAITLGPNQTKDHTVQAMRLRQLGSTQTVIFFAPPEVHQSILSLEKLQSNDKLTSYNVVSWLLKQTCLGIEQLLSCFYVQGVEFCNRIQASLAYPKLFDKTDQDRTSYLAAIRQVEALSLKELYGSQRKQILPFFQKWDPVVADIFEKLHHRCKEFLNSGYDYRSSAMQEVEQERDVLKEVEVIRQSQKPIHYQALSFPGLHPDIRQFLSDGKVRVNAEGYEPAFDYIGKTTIGKKHEINKEVTSQKLFVSLEYGRIIHQVIGNQTDHLYRPVNWVLWSTVSNSGMVIIPEEAEIIFTLLRMAASPVHLLSYAAPVTRKMLLFNDFLHYNMKSMPSEWCAPSWLRIEVGILSGRQYFDYDEYNTLMKYLGVQQIDGRIVEKIDESDENAKISGKKSNSFTSKPLCFLQEWLALRSHGLDFRHTPMGYICQGRPLLEQISITKRYERIKVNFEDDEDYQVVLDTSMEQQEEQEDLLGLEAITLEEEYKETHDYANDDLLNFSFSDSENENENENENKN